MKTITEQKQTRNVKRETWHNEKITQSQGSVYLASECLCKPNHQLRQSCSSANPYLSSGSSQQQDTQQQQQRRKQENFIQQRM